MDIEKINMKTQIRRGAFETNSSSTHAINIYRGCDTNIPETIYVRPGEFGWECDTFSWPEDKLSYLYTWCLSRMSKEDAQDKIKEALLNLGVKEVIFEDGGTWWEDGYIDHSEDLYNDDLETIFNNYFEDFIFNSASYIETGNDNDDIDVCEDSSADFSLYKGN